MNNDTIMFAAIFLISITVVCAGVVIVALNQIGSSSKARRQRRRTGYSHRAFKDVM